MPVKIKQNINININTNGKETKKDKTKKARTKRNIKKAKMQNASELLKKRNYGYDPNSKTIMEPPKTMGGGGTIQLNKTDYDMLPYSRFTNPNNSSTNLTNDLNNRFLDYEKNHKNLYDNFKTGFNNYHNDFILPELEKTKKRHDKLNTQVNMNEINEELGKEKMLNSIDDTFQEGFKMYHKDVIEPYLKHHNDNLTNIYHTQNNLYDNYQSAYNKIIPDLDRIHDKMNNIQLVQHQIINDQLPADYTNSFINSSDVNRIDYIVDNDQIDMPFIDYSSPRLLENYQPENTIKYESKIVPKWLTLLKTSSSEINDPYDLNNIKSSLSPINTKDDQQISNFNLKDDYFSQAFDDSSFNSKDDNLTQAFKNPSFGYLLKHETGVKPNVEVETVEDETPLVQEVEDESPLTVVQEVEPLPMNLAGMNMNMLNYINVKNKLGITMMDYKTVDQFKNLIKAKMPKTDKDRKLIFDIPVNLMTDAEIKAGKAYKKELDNKDIKAKDPKKKLFGEVAISQMNKPQLERVYYKLGFAYNDNLTKKELVDYLKKSTDQRKFKVQL